MLHLDKLHPCLRQAGSQCLQWNFVGMRVAWDGGWLVPLVLQLVLPVGLDQDALGQSSPCPLIAPC